TSGDRGVQRLPLEVMRSSPERSCHLPAAYVQSRLNSTIMRRGSVVSWSVRTASLRPHTILPNRVIGQRSPLNKNLPKPAPHRGAGKGSAARNIIEFVAGQASDVFGLDAFARPPRASCATCRRSGLNVSDQSLCRSTRQQCAGFFPYPMMVTILRL